MIAEDHHPCTNETAAEECHSYAVCSDGGYCECKSGYQGDGKNDCKGNLTVSDCLVYIENWEQF